jgi:hypothetical protein
VVTEVAAVVFLFGDVPVFNSFEEKGDLLSMTRFDPSSIPVR